MIHTAARFKHKFSRNLLLRNTYLFYWPKNQILLFASISYRCRGHEYRYCDRFSVMIIIHQDIHCYSIYVEAYDYVEAIATKVSHASILASAFA